MVRKFMGHGGLSALLGFGIFGTLFLLCKRKWGCALFSAPLAFVYAGISEGIQYFTPGRFCTITDVLIDFIGALIGMGVAIVLVALVLGIWRLASKRALIHLRMHTKSSISKPCLKRRTSSMRPIVENSNRRSALTKTFCKTLLAT